MKFVKLIAGIFLTLLTGFVLYLLFRMFIVFAGFSGISVHMTGLYSAILIAYIISMILWGRSIFEKWVMAFFEKRS